MIIKAGMILKSEDRDITIEADVIVDDVEQAQTAGNEYWQLAYAFARGMDEAIADTPDK